MALIIGIPLGILGAIKKNPILDLTIRITGLLGLSLPQFWLASLMVIAFSGIQGLIPMGELHTVHTSASYKPQNDAFAILGDWYWTCRRDNALYAQ